MIQDDPIVVVKDVSPINEDKLLSKNKDIAPGNPPYLPTLPLNRRRTAREEEEAEEQYSMGSEE